MYHRVIQRIIIITLLLCSAYSILWLIQAQSSTSAIKQAQHFIDSHIDTPNYHFIYGHTQTSGFPYTLNIAVHEPTFIIPKSHNTAAIKISSLEPIIISSTLFSDDINITLPPSIIVATSHEDSLEFIFESPAKLSVQLTKNHLLPTHLQTIFLSKLRATLHELNYTDKGFSVVSSTGRTIASSKKNSLNLRYQGKLHNKLATHLIASIHDLNINDIKNDVLNNDNDHLYSPVSIALDTMLVSPQDTLLPGTKTQIRVNEISYRSDMFEAQLYADLTRSKPDPLPFGKARLSLHNYANFVDYHSQILNYYTAHSNSPLKQINHQTIRGIKHFLSTLATEHHHFGRDILIITSRKKHGNISIGARSFEQAIELLAHSIMQPHNVDDSRYAEY